MIQASGEAREIIDRPIALAPGVVRLRRPSEVGLGFLPNPPFDRSTEQRGSVVVGSMVSADA